MGIDLVQPELTSVQIGSALTMMRKYLKHKQETLAEVLEITVSSYCRTEKGERTLKFSEAVLACSFYGITEDDLAKLGRIFDQFKPTFMENQEAAQAFADMLDRYERDQSENKT